MAFHVRTQSDRETYGFGRRFGSSLRKKRTRSARVVALTGELGSGKTTFVRGLANGLRVRSRVASPTFLIMRKHKMPGGTFWHIDSYRVRAKDLRALGFRILLRDPKNVVVVEWADRVRRVFPRDTKWISFRHGRTRNTRTLRMKKFFYAPPPH